MRMGRRESGMKKDGEKDGRREDNGDRKQMGRREIRQKKQLCLLINFCNPVNGPTLWVFPHPTALYKSRAAYPRTRTFLLPGCGLVHSSTTSVLSEVCQS